MAAKKKTASKKADPKKIKAVKSPELQPGSYIVKPENVKELNLFDMTGENANTKGTSNKFYHAELQEAKDDSGKCQLYTEYGPTGRVQAREYRIFDSVEAGLKEMNKIIKSKQKKGYVLVDVAQRVVGSADAQAIVKPVNFKNADEIKTSASKLNSAQKEIVGLFFNAQDTFVAQTLKCPLGQLSNDQIDKGNAVLDEAFNIINNNKNLSDDQLKELGNLTNRFYSLIPHNLGAGSRGQMTQLLFDSTQKITQKKDDLDILLDAKQVGAVLKADSTVDDKYKSLNCEFDSVDPASDLFKFLSDYFEGSKVRGHGYDREKVTRIWSMRRKDSKESAFIKVSESIAKTCKGHTFVEQTKKLSGGKSKNWAINNRPDLDKEEKTLYNGSNVWLCWHGTRSANLVGITRKGLLVRPTGAVHTGSMFGDGKYFAWQSTKSLNYCDGGYWTGGRGNVKRYMFLMDVSLGNQHIAERSHFYKKPPKGTHSVYGKAGYSLRNDEMITYDFEDKDNQSSIRYLFEIV